VGVNDGRGYVVEVVEIAPGLFAAALLRRVVDWLGRPTWSYVRHAGGGSALAAWRALGAPPTVTVIQNLQQAEWQR
jgi:hypothetical protein